MRTTTRKLLRVFSQKYPQLVKYSGRLGLGRLVAPSNTHEQILIDGDVRIELDMSIPFFRFLYFHYDFANSPELLLLPHLLRQNETCIDVGAHIGYFCLVAAKYAGEVIAFEPSPTNFAFLQRNLDINPLLKPKIIAIECGLSNETRRLQLHFSASQPSIASLTSINAPDEVTQNIHLTTLDESVSAIKKPASLIKIDVEGAEYQVLEGGAKTIMQHRPLIMLELIERHQQRFSRSCADVVNLLVDWDYIPYKINSNPVKLVELHLDELSTVDENNALFVPRDKNPYALERITQGVLR